MAYSYETDDMNSLMFMIVMVAFGCTGLHAGTFMGNLLYDSKYDKHQKIAMTYALFLSSYGPWLSFIDRIPEEFEILKQMLK